MVRIARQSNTAMLIPGQYADITEAPSELITAIQHAHTILNWFENLPEEEVPPGWMWPFADEVGEWFEEIREIRRQKNDRHSDDRETVPMTDNAWQPGDEL